MKRLTYIKSVFRVFLRVPEMEKIAKAIFNVGRQQSCRPRSDKSPPHSELFTPISYPGAQLPPL